MPPRQSRMVDILLRRDPVWVNELLSPVSSGTVTLIGDDGHQASVPEGPGAIVLSAPLAE